VWLKNKKRTVFLLVLIPLLFGILSIASGKAVSGLIWVAGRYSQQSQGPGYSGLLIWSRDNLTRKEIQTQLILPFSRHKTPGWDRDGFEFRLMGLIEIKKSGDYVLGTESDDGSWIWIDGRLVLNNGGLHPPREMTSSIHLTEGQHLMEIRFENLGGEALLDFFWVQADGQQVPLLFLKSIDPKALETLSQSTQVLQMVSLICAQIARYWLIVFIPLFLYHLLFPTSSRIKEKTTCL
jgi:hypothetical protein